MRPGSPTVPLSRPDGPARSRLVPTAATPQSLSSQAVILVLAMVVLGGASILLVNLMVEVDNIVAIGTDMLGAGVILALLSYGALRSGAMHDADEWAEACAGWSLIGLLGATLLLIAAIFPV